MNKLLPLGLAAAFALTSVASLAAPVTPGPDKAAQPAPAKPVPVKDAKDTNSKIRVARTHHKSKAAHHKKIVKPQTMAQVNTKPKADVK